MAPASFSSRGFTCRRCREPRMKVVHAVSILHPASLLPSEQVVVDDRWRCEEGGACSVEGGAQTRFCAKMGRPRQLIALEFQVLQVPDTWTVAMKEKQAVPAFLHPLSAVGPSSQTVICSSGTDPAWMRAVEPCETPRPLPVTMSSDPGPSISLQPSLPDILSPHGWTRHPIRRGGSRQGEPGCTSQARTRSSSPAGASDDTH